MQNLQLNNIFMVFFSETEWDSMYNKQQVCVNLTETMSWIAAWSCLFSREGFTGLKYICKLKQI